MFDWLFGSGRQTNYDDAMKQAQQASKAQADATAYYYDNIDKNWDNLDQNARADVLSKYNQMNGAATNASQSYGDYFNTYNQEEKDNKYNYFGNGLLGAILNPIGQTASAAKDLATGQYQENGRDVASDLGAAGQTALSFLPFAGGLARAGGAIGKVGAGVGKAVNSVPGMALTGAGFNAGETLRQGGSDTNMGDLLGAAGTGAAFGAALPIVGGAAGKYLRSRGGKEIATKYLADPTRSNQAQKIIDGGGGKIGIFTQNIINRNAPKLEQAYGGLYGNALRSFVPKSTVGKLAAGGAGIYGASRLMGSGGEQQDPTAQLVAQFEQRYGYTPSEYELQLLTAQGGY